MTPVVLNYGIGVWSGWGVVGLNTIGQFEGDPDFTVYSGHPLGANMCMGMDPLRYSVIERCAKRSEGFKNHEEAISIESVGNDLRSYVPGEYRTKVGRVIIEKPDITHAIENLDTFDEILTASQWNQEVIENICGRQAAVILEGVDPSVFVPGPKSGWLGETFNIYSCGKVEYRKAQDVVLKAFKVFSERHSDARLVTVWNSPFADIGNGFRGTLEHPLWMKENGFLDVKRWAHDNGVDSNKVLELGCVPNWMLPPVLREMDVMLAPSRVESCTSLPVMEAMACGVPVVASYHTGMKDLLTSFNSYRLMDQKPITGSNEYFFPQSDIEWYESNLDEILAKLEWVYTDRDTARFKAKTASEWIRKERTWEIHCNKLKTWLKSITHETERDAQTGT